MTTPIPEPSASAATDTETTTTTETSSGVPIWAWVLGALALLGLAAFFMRRRREEPVWEGETVHEPVDQEPFYEERTVAPLAAAPLADDVVVEDRAEVVTPAADEIAAITAASAPVTGRPWIELSLRPVRAGMTGDVAMVDLELTLANAGEVAARNVRVTTSMLSDGSNAPTEVDQLQAASPTGTEVSTGDIAPGEGARVDASLTASRNDLSDANFQPIVIADVRYTLPDGGEGRTAAAFAIGQDDGTEGATSLYLDGDVREDVAATLHGVPERA